jgi:hypothetical protein
MGAMEFAAALGIAYAAIPALTKNNKCRNLWWGTLRLGATAYRSPGMSIT